jgi:uncharacterized protein YraI
MIRKMIGAGAAIAIGTVALANANSSGAASRYYRTTDYLNLRKGPSTNHGVIAVMPPQSLVEYLGEYSGSYLKVVFQGQTGWAHFDYLTASDGGSSEMPVLIGTGVTTSAVNMRSGPSTGHSVIRVLPAGTTIDIFDRVEYGFRYVGYAAQGGWVYEEFISSGDGGGLGGTAIATTDLNLRESPDRSARVLDVIPEGGEVFFGDQIANGFRNVSYNGVSGWAWNEYLSPGGGQPGGNLETTDYVNFRAEPSMSARIISVLSPGTSVRGGDQVVNGFRQVTVSGTTGWVYDDFLR